MGNLHMMGRIFESKNNRREDEFFILFLIFVFLTLWVGI